MNNTYNDLKSKCLLIMLVLIIIKKIGIKSNEVIPNTIAAITLPRLAGSKYLISLVIFFNYFLFSLQLLQFLALLSVT